MTIPILIEPIPTGYRATATSHVLPLTENPLLDDWLWAVEEYRDEIDAGATRNRRDFGRVSGLLIEDWSV